MSRKSMSMFGKEKSLSKMIQRSEGTLKLGLLLLLLLSTDLAQLDPVRNSRGNQPRRELSRYLALN
jgi:hypothetical protein